MDVTLHLDVYSIAFQIYINTLELALYQLWNKTFSKGLARPENIWNYHPIIKRGVTKVTLVKHSETPLSSVWNKCEVTVEMCNQENPKVKQKQSLTQHGKMPSICIICFLHSSRLTLKHGLEALI